MCVDDLEVSIQVYWQLIEVSHGHDAGIRRFFSISLTWYVISPVVFNVSDFIREFPVRGA